MSDDDDPAPFSRETGLFVSSGEDGDELRLHRREGGRWHWHRWRVSPGDLGQEPRWIGPVAFGVTAKEVFDAAEALRRAADDLKVQPDAQPARARRGRPKPSVDRPEDAPLDGSPDDQRTR